MKKISFPVKSRRLATCSFLMAMALLPLPGLVHAQSTDGLNVPRPVDPAAAKAEIDAQKLTKIPKQKKFVQADYPPEAKAKGITADVVLLLDINAEGKIDSVGIAEPANPPGMGFDEAALIAAQQFEFEPAEMGGKKIAVQITYKYRFTLAARPVDSTPPTSTPATGPAGADAPPTDATTTQPAGTAGNPAAPATAAAATTAPKKAPVANFTGLLRERGTRLPMSGILVTVFRDDGEKAVGFESASDETGAFTFFDLTPGEWKVLIEAPGFYPYRTTETITVSERVNATYYVERGAYNPYDVTVTATRPRKEVSRTVLSAQEIEKIPGAAGDPLAVIQNFAGVARPPVASGQIIIRGSAPQDSKVFVEGAEVPLIYHFGGLRSVIPAGMLDSIQFYPGNFSPMYGRATGGIIDVQIKKLQPKKIGGYADVNLFDSGVFLEIPVTEKFSMALAGRRSYVDYLLNAAVPSDANVNLVTAPRYYDGQLLLNYRPAPAHDLRALVFASDDRLELLFKNPANFSPDASSNVFSASTTFYRSVLSYRFIPNDHIENNLRVSQGRNWFAFRAAPFVFDLNTYTSQIRDSLRWKASEKFTLHAGFDGLFSKTDITVNLPRPPKEGEPPNNMPDLSMTSKTSKSGILLFSPAGYLEGEWKPIAGLLVLPGLRFDYFSRIHQSLAQPRLTTRYGVTDKVTVKGGVGLFVQEPQFDETDDVFGNPNLKAEKAIHWSAGTEYKPRPWITLDATGFYKTIYNLVSSTTATRDNNGVAVPLVYDNNGSGRVYGLELVARHEFANNFTGWLAYTLSRATRRDSGSTEDRLFDYDQTHILTLIGSYVLPRNWQIGGRFRLVTGSPTTPVTGAVFNASRDQYDPTYGAVNSSRLPMFNQLDVRIDKKWVNQGWMLNLYLDVQNVYDRANTEGVSYNFNYRKSSTQQGLPLLTILGLRAEF